MALLTLERKLVRLTTEAVQPDLGQDETVELVSGVVIGEPDRPKNAAIGLAAAAGASLGVGGAIVLRARLFVILTSERVLFLERNGTNAKPIPGVVAEIPRRKVQAEPRKSKFAGSRVALVDRQNPSAELVVLDFLFVVKSDATALILALG